MTAEWDKLSLEWGEGKKQSPRMDQEEIKRPSYEGKARTSVKLYMSALSAGVYPFKDRDTGDICVSLDCHGRKDVFPLYSSVFRAFLTKMYYEETGEVVSQTAMEETSRLLEADARSRLPVVSFLRTGYRGKTLYLDLADEQGRVIEIDGQGWRLSEQSPLFRRNQAMRPLPLPKAGGSLDLLRQFLNTDGEESFILAVSWLFAALHPRGPFPVGIVSGEHGSGKSMIGTLLKRIIDPDRAMKRSMPKDEDGLFAAAASHWVLHFDNLSSLKTDTSDQLCRLASGGGISKRKLFTDNEEFTMEAARPIVLNGIGLSPDRPDLLSRSLNIRLRVLQEEERRTETELEQAFRKAHPLILGALLDAASTALKCKDFRPVSLPRLADASLWILKAEQGNALPWKSGGFLAALKKEQSEAEDEILSSNVVSSTIMGMMENSNSWRGLLKTLLGTIREEAGNNRNFCPSNEKALWNSLERLMPLLRRRGIRVQKTSRQAAGTVVLIVKEEKAEPNQIKFEDAPFSLFESEGGVK